MTALPLRSLSAALLGCAVAALAHAQPAPGTEAQAQARRDALRAQIQSERRAIDARRLQEEGACYRQFAVEDCLRGARARARTADDALRQRELQINDEERREKAGQRLKDIEDKQREQQERLQAGERPAPMQGAPRTDAQARERAQREQDARERARQQQQREAGHAAQQERRNAAQQQRIDESRSRYETKQQKALERREKHERQRAEAAAAGKAPAAPLPPASAP